jgi:dTDP-4-dehydrorhamnose reductase
LTVIDDQWGAPTGAELIADVSAHAIAQVLPARQGRLYHLAAAGETTWFSYANTCWRRPSKRNQLLN